MYEWVFLLIVIDCFRTLILYVYSYWAATSARVVRCVSRWWANTRSCTMRTPALSPRSSTPECMHTSTAASTSLYAPSTPPPPPRPLVQAVRATMGLSQDEVTIVQLDENSTILSHELTRGSELCRSIIIIHNTRQEWNTCIRLSILQNNWNRTKGQFRYNHNCWNLVKNFCFGIGTGALF